NVRANDQLNLRNSCGNILFAVSEHTTNVVRQRARSPMAIARTRERRMSCSHGQLSKFDNVDNDRGNGHRRQGIPLERGLHSVRLGIHGASLLLVRFGTKPASPQPPTMSYVSEKGVTDSLAAAICTQTLRQPGTNPDS